MVAFGRGPFGHYFLDRNLIKIRSLGTLKTLTICVRGCKNHVFGYVAFGSILGIVLVTILEPERLPKSHWDSLWGPYGPILAPFSMIRIVSAFLGRRLEPQRSLNPPWGRGVSH